MASRSVAMVYSRRARIAIVAPRIRPNATPNVATRPSVSLTRAPIVTRPMDPVVTSAVSNHRARHVAIQRASVTCPSTVRVIMPGARRMCSNAMAKSVRTVADAWRAHVNDGIRTVLICMVKELPSLIRAWPSITKCHALLSRQVAIVASSGSVRAQKHITLGVSGRKIRSVARPSVSAVTMMRWSRPSSSQYRCDVTASVTTWTGPGITTKSQVIRTTTSIRCQQGPHVVMSPSVLSNQTVNSVAICKFIGNDHRNVLILQSACCT